MNQQGLSLGKRKFKNPVVLATGILVDNDTTVVDKKHWEEASVSSSQSNGFDSNVEISASLKREHILTVMTTNRQRDLLEQTHYRETNNYACPDCCRIFSTEHEVMVHSLTCQYNVSSPLSTGRPELKYSTEEGVEVQEIDMNLNEKDDIKNRSTLQQDDIQKNLKENLKPAKVGIIRLLFMSCFSRKKRKDTFDTENSSPSNNNLSTPTNITEISSPMSLYPLDSPKDAIGVGKTSNDSVRSEGDSQPPDEMSLTSGSVTTNSTGESQWIRDNGSYEMQLSPTLLGRKRFYSEHTTTVPSEEIFDDIVFEPFISIVGEMK